jgi:pimeloyl-ACP methyl ester carboxylesterase
VTREPGPDGVWQQHFGSIRRIKVDGLRIRYVDAGDGPCVFLIHGIGHSAFGWRHSLGPLAESGFRVLAIDTPGFGYSDPLPEEAIRDPTALPKAIADLLDRVLDTFDITSCSVIGHSLGGAYATLLAAEHPERVERLVLAAPAVGPHVGLGLRLLTMRVGQLAFRPTPQFIRWSISQLANSSEAIDDQEVEEIVRTLSQPQVRRFFLELLKVGLGLRGIRPDFVLLSRLAEVRAPTLVLWGRHDHILPLRNADLILGQLPEARLEIFEHSGHMLMLEETNRFNELVLRFLEPS